MTMRVVRAAGGVALFSAMIMDALVGLEDRRTQLFDECQNLINSADQDGIDLSDDDLATIEKNQKEIEKLDKQIAARKAVRPVSNGPRTTREPGTPDNSSRRVSPQPRVVDRRGGFAAS